MFILHIVRTEKSALFLYHVQKPFFKARRHNEGLFSDREGDADILSCFVDVGDRTFTEFFVIDYCADVDGGQVHFRLVRFFLLLNGRCYDCLRRGEKVRLNWLFGKFSCFGFFRGLVVDGCRGFGLHCGLLVIEQSLVFFAPYYGIPAAYLVRDVFFYARVG